MSASPIDIMAEAIATANIKYPRDAFGTLRDQHVMSYEDAVHLANAARLALDKAGFKIVPIEKESTNAAPQG